MTAIDNLNLSLDRLTHRTNGNIWLGEDFKAPHIDWSSMEVSMCVKVVVELQMLESGRARDVHASTVDVSDARHQLFHHRPAASRLKSRKSFMRPVTPLDSSASSSRLRLWKDSLTDVPGSVNMGLEMAEYLPAGSGEDWLCWRSLNRLRTGVGRAKTVMRKWGYLEDAQSVDCDCGGHR